MGLDQGEGSRNEEKQGKKKRKRELVDVSLHIKRENVVQEIKDHDCTVRELYQRNQTTKRREQGEHVHPLEGERGPR